LPDDQLESVLNALAQNGKLQSLFEDHNFAANALNSIAQKTGNVSNIAINYLGRELNIDSAGAISIVP
jgi:DNA-binding TFAR19-related protein (PDSD5 family)